MEKDFPHIFSYPIIQIRLLRFRQQIEVPYCTTATNRRIKKRGGGRVEIGLFSHIRSAELGVECELKKNMAYWKWKITSNMQSPLEFSLHNR